MIRITVHDYAQRPYVMVRRHVTTGQAIRDEPVSAYRVTEEGKLTRIVRWPLEPGGNGGERAHEPD
jgi:hypothetical protein